MIHYAISTTPDRGLSFDPAELEDPITYVDYQRTGGSWCNYSRALFDHAELPDDDWLVSVDDDAKLCKNFAYQVAHALAECPGEIVTLYYANRNVVSQARAKGADWIRSYRICHGVGWALRVRHARSVIRLADRDVDPSYPSGDQRLVYWAIKTGNAVYAPLPSLANHDISQRSLISGRYYKHGAAYFDPDIVKLGYSLVFDDPHTPEHTLARLRRGGMFR